MGGPSLPGHLAEGAAGSRARECLAFLRSVPILFELDDTMLWDLALAASTCEFDPGARIVAQGADERDEGRRFYIIRSGSADVLRRDRGGFERVVARLTLGSYFGELGLLTNQARNATVRVHGAMPLRAYAFDALTFHRRIAEHVLVFRLLRERQEQMRTGRGRGRLRIRQLDLLSRLPAPDLEFVLRNAEQRWFPERSTIVSQGDEGDRFYIVLEGSVDVVRNEVPIARLGAGEFFGETALLLDTRRTATVAASERTLVWSIARPAFQRLVGSYLLANPRTQDEIMRRMRTVLPAGGAGTEA